MPLRTFTFFQLGRDLDGIGPGFDLTVDYEILESLIESVESSRPPNLLRDELRQLANEHHCDFKDWVELRFVHFIKRSQ